MESIEVPGMAGPKDDEPQEVPPPGQAPLEGDPND